MPIPMALDRQVTFAAAGGGGGFQPIDDVTAPAKVSNKPTGIDAAILYRYNQLWGRADTDNAASNVDSGGDWGLSNIDLEGNTIVPAPAFPAWRGVYSWADLKASLGTNGSKHLMFYDIAIPYNSILVPWAVNDQVALWYGATPPQMIVFGVEGHFHRVTQKQHIFKCVFLGSDDGDSEGLYTAGRSDTVYLWKYGTAGGGGGGGGNVKIWCSVDDRPVVDQLGAGKVVNNFIFRYDPDLIKIDNAFVDDRDVEWIIKGVERMGRNEYARAIAQVKPPPSDDNGSG